MAGRFITFEGGEGAGKSTQARLLADWLAQSGQPVLLTREPGGAPGAELLRQLLLSGDPEFAPEAELLLHFAARAEHVARSIGPALAAGLWVVCDRFFDSTMAYQGYGQGADRATIAKLSAMLGIRPDLTLMLDVSIATTLQRLRQRGAQADRYERLGAAFFQRVATGFSEIAQANHERCCMIKAEGKQEEISKDIRALVQARLGRPSCH